MRASVHTVDGLFAVDVETDELVDPDADAAVAAPARLDLALPRVVAAAVSGSTVVAIVDRRPPLALSYDAGSTWNESGGGLPPGRAVAVSVENPDFILYAARNRLFFSRDGGRFWRALTPELPEILRIDFS